jgi:hypothetical protein
MEEIMYTIKPEFKQELIKCIGDYPFSQINELMNKVEPHTINNEELKQIINVIAGAPYIRVSEFMNHINEYVTSEIC